MKKLCMITKSFPFGDEEKAFLQYEVPLLAKNFELTVVAAELNEKFEMECQEEYHTLIIKKEAPIIRKIISMILFLCKKEAWEEIIEILKNGKWICKRLFRMLMFGTAAETFWYHLKEVYGIDKNTDTLFYFYWWDYKCLGITMHKKKYPKIRVVTRTHGYDLYDERELYGRQFFKKQMERKLDKIFFISSYGREYYVKRSGRDDRDKFLLHRLGVSEQSIKWHEKSEDFVLVSCSNVIPLKRIELIVQGLALIPEIRIKWIHFGDGSELNNIKNLAQNILEKKENISYSFAGRVDNKQVLDYYRNFSVSCFITTTSTEGNPVSVQEALSFGLPIIGTEVSDIPLMICGNGFLLPQNPNPAQVAAAIEEMASATPEERQIMRKKSYEIWKRDYNAEKNYAEFVRKLLEVTMK